MTSLVAIMRDISKRIMAEGLLLAKTALLEGQTETTLDGIDVVDEADVIVLANRQFQLIFGIPDALLNTSDDQLVRNHVMKRWRVGGCSLKESLILNVTGRKRAGMS